MAVIHAIADDQIEFSRAPLARGVDDVRRRWIYPADPRRAGDGRSAVAGDAIDVVFAKARLDLRRRKSRRRMDARRPALRGVNHGRVGGPGDQWTVWRARPDIEGAGPHYGQTAQAHHDEGGDNTQDELEHPRPRSTQRVKIGGDVASLLVVQVGAGHGVARGDALRIAEPVHQVGGVFGNMPATMVLRAKWFNGGPTRPMACWIPGTWWQAPHWTRPISTAPRAGSPPKAVAVGV
jgi:hypothetical protein